MSLAHVMREFAREHSDLTPEQLAAQFRMSIDKQKLDPVLAAEFQQIRRSWTRHLEREVMAEVAQGAIREMHARGWADALKGQPYSIGDGEERLFEKMTVVQHQTRITMLLRMRDGLDQSIELHRRAVEEIQAAGVTCLDEIEDHELAAAA